MANWGAPRVVVARPFGPPAADVVPTPALSLPPSEPALNTAAATFEQPPPNSAAPELDAVLRRGGHLWKLGPSTRTLTSSAVARRRWFQVVGAERDVCLQWHDPERPTRKARSLSLQNVGRIVVGRLPEALARSKRTKPYSESLSFSLHADRTTLHLAATNERERDAWLRGLERYIAITGGGLGEDTATTIPRPSTLPHAARSAPSRPAPSRRMGDERLLFQHCAMNRCELLADMFSSGWDVGTMEPETGDTPLMLACRLGLVEVVELCLRYGAANDPHPEFGQTALQAAVASGQHACAKLLLRTAARSQMDHVIVDHADSARNAPLHVAATIGHSGVLRLLLEHGAKVSLVDGHGRTPLHCAASSGHADCVGILLEAGADVLIDLGDHTGNTSLHAAVAGGSSDVVRLLLQTMADPRVPNAHGTTPYQLAQLLKHTENMAMLREYAASFEHIPKGVGTRCLLPGERTADVATGSQAAEPPLPSGPAWGWTATTWHKYFDADEGYAYFVQEESGASQWEDPRLADSNATVIDGTTGEIAPPPEHYGASSSVTTDSSRADCTIAGQHDSHYVPVDEADKAVPSVGARLRAELGRARRLASENANLKLEARAAREMWARDRASRQAYSSAIQGDHASKGMQPQRLQVDSDSEMAAALGDARGSYAPEAALDGFVQRDVDLVDASACRRAWGEKAKENADARKSESYGLKGSAPLLSKSTVAGYTTEDLSPYGVDDSVYRLDIDEHENRKVNVTTEQRSSNGNGRVEHAERRGARRYESKLGFRPSTDGDDFSESDAGSSDNSDHTFNSESDDSVDNAHLHTNCSVKRSHRRKHQQRRGVTAREKRQKAPVRQRVRSNGCSESDEVSAEADACNRAEAENSGTADLIPSKTGDTADPRYSKYFMMRRVGVSAPSIRQKMEVDGVPSSIIDAVLRAEPAPPPSSCARSQDVSSTTSDTPTTARDSGDDSGKSTKRIAAAELEKMPAVAKYNRMRKMGLQMGAIVQRMSMDGLSPVLVDQFVSAFGSDADRPNSRSGMTQAADTPRRRTSSQSLLKLHWQQLPAERLENSVWATTRTRAQGGAEGLVGQDEIKQLEALFSASHGATSRTRGPHCAKETGKPQKIKLVDPKRAHNVAIVLAQFSKHFRSHAEIAAAIENAELQRLPAAKLQLLEEVMPKDSEMALLRDFRGDCSNLGTTEAFFSSLLNVRRPGPKVRALLFQAQFVDQTLDQRDRAGCIIRACGQVRSSTRLAKVFDMILAVGNIMNEGSFQGGAMGFTLGSLLKLSETRAKDKKTTVVDYLVDTVKRREPELLNFIDELEDVERASKISSSDVRAETRALRRGLEELNATLRAEMDEGMGSSGFCSCCLGFLDNAEGEMSAVEALTTEMVEACREVAKYFAEDPETCSSIFIFEVMNKFRQSVVNSMERDTSRAHK